MFKSSLLTLIIVPSLGCLTASAQIPRPSIGALLDGSDLIVKGRVESTKVVAERAAAAAGTKEVFGVCHGRFQWTGLLKGEPPEDKDIVVEIKLPPVNVWGYETLVAGQSAILYLRREEPGHYAPSTPYRFTTSIPVSSLNTSVGGGTPGERLANEMAVGLNTGDRATILYALSILAELRDARAARAIKPLLQFDDTFVKGSALQCLLALGESAHFHDAMRFLDDQHDDPHLSRLRSGIIVWLGQLQAPELAPEMGNLLVSSQDENLCRAAAESLRRMKEPKAVPYLVRGLDSPDSWTRYYCLMGLAETVGRFQEWAPCFEVFFAKQEGYLQRWKQWWREQGGHLYPGQEPL